MTKPSVNKSAAASGRNRALSISDAMNGEIEGYSKETCADSRARVTLADCLKDPMRVAFLNARSLKVLIRECVYRIRILEKQLTDSQAEKEWREENEEDLAAGRKRYDNFNQKHCLTGNGNQKS